MKRTGDAYRFPWTPAALEMVYWARQTEGRPMPYRQIAIDLKTSHLVDQVPDAATIRRAFARQVRALKTVRP
jgi:hypothetical protein